MQIGVAFIWHVVVDDNIDLTVQYIQYYTVIHDQKYSQMKYFTGASLIISIQLSRRCSEGQDDLSVWSTLLSFQHTKATVSFQKSFVALHNDHSSNLGSILTPFSISVLSANSDL